MPRRKVTFRLLSVSGNKAISINYLNNTRNQHFVSQVEQSLNTCSPNHAKNKRIYAFRVKNRETFEVQLESNTGKPVKKTLQFYDLYSFDVISKELRLNFEKEFNQYETKIREQTDSLVDKVETNSPDIKREILRVHGKITSQYNPHQAMDK